MDTSDSEGCYESADEDFQSDEEYKPIEIEESKPAPVNLAKAGKKVNKISDSNVKVSEVKRSTRPEYGIPPARVECWEPGLHDDNIKRIIKEPHSGDDKRPARPEYSIPPARDECCEPELHDDNIIMVMKEPSSEDDKRSARQEYGIPPARVECWEPGLHDDKIKKVTKEPSSGVDKESVRPEYASPPSQVECWEPELHDDNNKELTKEPFSGQENNKSNRPEFGIPPKRVVCWVPGMQRNQKEKVGGDATDIEGSDRSADPPELVECWESDGNVNDPNDNNSIEKMVTDKKNNNLKLVSDNLHPISVKKIAHDIKALNINEESTNKIYVENSEYGIPPNTPVCCEFGVQEECISTTFVNRNIIFPEQKAQTGHSVNIDDSKNIKEDLNSKKKSGIGKDLTIEPDKSEGTKDIKEELNYKKKSSKGEDDIWHEDEGWDLKDEEDDKQFTDPEEETNTAVDGEKLQQITNEKGMSFQVQDLNSKMISGDEADLWNKNEGWEWNDEEDAKIKSEDMWAGADNWSTNATVGSTESGHNTESIGQEADDLWGEDDNWLDNSKIKTDVTKVKNSLDILSETSQSDSTWGGWGTWGISSVLSTAATITSSVSQGITTVLETGIGVPAPEDLARQHKAEKEKYSDMPDELIETTDSNTSMTYGLGNLVSGVSTITKLVESTSTKVISGGLDTLETMGKKTMEVLQKNDPGLKRKRAFLKIDQDKTVLSQVLREAKEKAEEENREREKRHYARKANYETIFDDYQGLVHLEALEMLSKQCEIKLQSVVSKCGSDALTDLQETLDQIKELCELPDEDEDESISMEEIKNKIDAAIEDIKVPITYNRLISRWSDMENWLVELNIESTIENEIHQYAIETLAELTAISVEQFHKAGELLLIKEHRSTADEADSLVQLTTTLSALISITASKFSEKLNCKATYAGTKEAINTLITNVFLEAANSSRYIQDAFQLLIPVLQVGTV